MAPVPALIVLAALGASALLAERPITVAAIAVLLLLVCLRAPRARRRLYLVGALTPGVGVVVLSPFLAAEGWTVLWEGPTVPVVGPLDVTAEEIGIALLNALRLTSLALAFAAYALLLDHDRLLVSAHVVRRSSVAAALATRLVPTLERDARALAESVRGRGVAVEGVHGHARLLSPLVAGSLERAANLAEAMEARGFGRRGATRAPRPAWRPRDHAAALAALALLVVAALWL